MFEFEHVPDGDFAAVNLASVDQEHSHGRVAVDVPAFGTRLFTGFEVERLPTAQALGDSVSHTHGKR